MTEIYAVSYEESTTIPGDERSRTNPGHGYPEHTVSTQVFKRFNNFNDFENWVHEETHKSYGKRAFKAYRCTELFVTTKIHISD